jgi:NAD(P)-dependent dehydrogenase (short-subunit alcohol dehydrogenase family)
MSGEQLRGRRILITGAASGIGRKTAEIFAAEGAGLALLDRNAQALGAIAAATGGTPLAADLTTAKAVEEAVITGAEALGGLDGVVNAAGIVARGKLADMELAEWTLVQSVNLTGPFLVCKSAIPHLVRAEAATIVNVASASGLLPSGANGGYAAPKAGLIALTKVFAVELAPKVRVNVVCPGSVETPLLRGVLPDSEEARERIKQVYALQRVADPREIADAILFLTSGQSSYITGAALAVDGGRSYH